MELRDYQLETINAVESQLMFDNLAVVGMSMGGGKSLIISHLARDFSNQSDTVVVLTNITALIPQLAKHLEAFGVEFNIVKAGMHDVKPNAKVWLIMEQSFHENKRAELNINCDVLIKDEFHIGKGQKRYEDIKRSLNPNSVVGLSGTPFNEKGYLMHGVTPDQVITHGNAAELTNKGYLVPIKVFVPKWSEDIDYSDVAASGNDYSGAGLDEIIDTDAHTQLIIKSMEEMNAKSKKTLVYASSVEHAETIFEALSKHGYSCGVVHSKRASSENDVCIKRFKGEQVRTETTLIDDGSNLEELDCLVSVSQLTIGFDAPAAELLVLCRPTKVLRLFLQIVGRVGRTNEGKEYSELLDLAQCTKEHGFFTEPRPLIQEGDKRGMLRAKEEHQCDVLSTFVEETPTEVTRHLVDIKLKELIQKANNIPAMEMKELIAFYDTTIDIKTIINIACEIGARTKNNMYDKTTVEWIAEPWMDMINEFPEHKYRLIKTLKTMSKTKIKQNKKISALHYVVKEGGWLRQQPPFNVSNYSKLQDIDIDEDDIPF